MAKMTVLRRYTVTCGKCGGEARMVIATTELGHTDSFCERWCQCPPSQLVNVNLPISREEGDPEPS